MPSLSDNGGILSLVNSTGGTVNSYDYATIQGNRFIVEGPAAGNGATVANGALCRARPVGVWASKIHVAAPKTAGQAWTAGQTVYLISATNVWTTTKGTNLVGGIVAKDAASADTTGDVLPGIPLVAAV